MREFFRNLASKFERGETVDLMERTLKNIVTEVEKRFAQEEQIKFYLSLLYYQCRPVYNHSCRVACYAYLLGKKVGLGKETCLDLGLAGLLHDLGKLYIPSRILSKPGSLTIKEFKRVQKHVLYSSEIVEKWTNLQVLSLPILFHHERWDGCGYPWGLKGEEIPLLARVLTIADSFDAMTSNRVYQEVKNFQQAQGELLLCSSKQFDPYLTRNFLVLLTTIGETESVFLSLKANESSYWVRENFKGRRKEFAGARIL